ncbi:MAG: caspase family protein [Bacteroidota bacterium]
MEIVQEEKNIIAVIIAIENYRFSENGGISNVEFAKNDATKFKELLINNFGAKEENITLWINEQATKTALENELLYNINQLSPNDKFIFYYAGHGFHNGDTNRLTVWDSHTTDLFGTSVALDKILLTPLTESPCDNSLIFLDACSTNIDKSMGKPRDLMGSMDTKEFEKFGSISKYNAIFSSCSPGEKSFPSHKLQHGIWTWHLLEALKGNTPLAIFKDEFITDTSLQNYLRQAVPDFIKNNTNLRSKQTPYAKISASNTFIIRKLPSSPIVGKQTKNLPKMKLNLDNLKMRLIEIQDVEKLSGFKQTHIVPLKVYQRGNDFVRSIYWQTIINEIQTIYENSKSTLKLKRRDIQKEESTDGISIENPIFKYYHGINQHYTNPAKSIITRELIIKVDFNKLPVLFSFIFPKQINEILIPIEDEIDFDDLVDKFENLKEEFGGKLKDDDNTGIIIYTTIEDLNFTILTKQKTLKITPNTPTRMFTKFIEAAAEGLKNITTQKWKLMQ